MLKWSNDPYVGLDIAKIFDIEKHRSGDTAMLSGLVCAFHPAALGLSPKHTIYAFIHLLKYCTVEKTARTGLFFFKNIALQNVHSSERPQARISYFSYSST